MAKKISNSLVTLSSAAILAVYAAGYERTTPAANRFATELAQRHAPTPNEAPLPNRLPAAVQTPEPAVVSAAKPTDRRAEKPAPVSQATIPETQSPSTPVPTETTRAATASVEPSSEPASPAAPAVDVSQIESVSPYRDGVFLGWGYSRHGNIQAFVRIEGGRIVNAGVQRCETRWPCDLVAHLPGQVIARQSAEVDYVTGATQSGDAFYGAIAAALKQAK